MSREPGMRIASVLARASCVHSSPSLGVPVRPIPGRSACCGAPGCRAYATWCSSTVAPRVSDPVCSILRKCSPQICPGQGKRACDRAKIAWTLYLNTSYTHLYLFLYACGALRQNKARRQGVAQQRMSAQVGPGAALPEREQEQIACKAGEVGCPGSTSWETNAPTG